nr:flagellar protein FlgN [uncultured Aminipila sp.]
MNNYVEIKEIMDEYIKLMDKLISFEQEKLEAIKDKKIDQMDMFLKEEQAYILQLRGLDGKREATQKRLGVEGLTYRQIINQIEQAEDSLRVELENSYQVLSIKTKQFKEIISTIKTYIDIRLHTIDAFIEKISTAPPQSVQSGIYDKIANQNDDVNNRISRFKSTKA